MKLGLFLMPMYPPAKGRTCSFEEDLALVVLADQLGPGRLTSFSGMGADPRPCSLYSLPKGPKKHFDSSC